MKKSLLTFDFSSSLDTPILIPRRKEIAKIHLSDVVRIILFPMLNLGHDSLTVLQVDTLHCLKHYDLGKSKTHIYDKPNNWHNVINITSFGFNVAFNTL